MKAWCASGGRPTTYDRAGEPTSEREDVNRSDRDELEARSSGSAASSCRRRRRFRLRRSDGKRAYELARQAVAVELEPVQVSGVRIDAAGSGRRGGAGARALLGRHVHAIDRARCWARRWDAARIYRNCGGRPAAEFEIGQARTLEQLRIAGERRAADGCIGAGGEDAAGLAKCVCRRPDGRADSDTAGISRRRRSARVRRRST